MRPILLPFVVIPGVLASITELRYADTVVSPNTLRIGSPMSLGHKSKFSTFGKATKWSYKMYFDWLTGRPTPNLPT